MTLEDSLGDILRKARTSTHTSPEAAATEAGLTLAAYAAMEDSGQLAAHTQFSPLCRRLSLCDMKLERIAHGWLPADVGVGQWRELRTITTAGDGMTVNAFLVWDPATREAALFDTGFDAAPIFALIEEFGLQLRHLFITHSHGDHVAAIGPIRQRFPAVELHSGSAHAPAAQRLTPGATFAVGALQVAFRETPGHADDGITYVITGWPGGAPAVAVVGDAIFAGSMGGARDLLPLARGKVIEHILSLPGPTLICPGHGPLTTVAQEQANNPWFP
jgi:glyoxylase-like metal-dependent hydrolase (beta-lactamase superfamily II)